MKVVRIDGAGAHLGRGNDDTGLVPTLVQFGFHTKPRGRLSMTDQFPERFKGHEARPRQFSVRWQNSRCSILFHLLVPGGKCDT